MSFGTPLYCYKGIHVYSNDHSLIHDEYHSENGIQTGLRWQCVELARRYLIFKKGITFDSVDNAYNIFTLPHFSTVHTHNPVPIRAVANGESEHPHIGSLLIWEKEYDANETGHVAVITHIYPHSIQIMEQNNTQPIRTIPFTRNNRFVLHETHLLGWINYD